MGRRVNLATLDDKTVAVAAPAEAAVGVPLALLVANPRNPREALGDLSDLQSIVKRQLQPCLVVSAKGYLALWPEDAEKVGDAQYVVVNGCRRLAAARKFGRTDLLVVHDESVASSRGELLGAAVDENIGRQDFDIIEEARAVDAVVAEYSSTREAAKARGWTHGWISQRRALLKLSPAMQAALRAGDLAVRDARRLARVPAEEQVAVWRAEQEAAERRKKEEAERRKLATQQPAPAPASEPEADSVVTAVTTSADGSDPSTGDEGSSSVVTAVTTEEEGRGVPAPRQDAPLASGGEAGAAIAQEGRAFDRSGLPWADPEAFHALLLREMRLENRVELTKLLIASNTAAREAASSS